jgi:natural product biosynthesis luciferase-like monooxygenase protein/amino acid adenylation domain-containing protein
MQDSIAETLAGLSQEKRELLELLLKQETAARYGLSYAQKQMWFLHQVDQQSTVYNVPILLRIEGLLDVKALERGLNEIVCRHEILRTTFESENGNPVQVVAPQLQLPLEISDAQQIENIEERELAALEVADEVIQTPFNLATGPLLRPHLILLGAQEQLLVLAFHHIVFDMWSATVLMRELTQLYQAFAEGKESPLPELPIQYADYAEWEREWLEGDAIRGQLSYWKRQLAGVSEMLELPADHPRSALRKRCASRAGVKLAPELCRGLRRMMQEEEVTLFMALLAGLQITLARYSGQREVLVGSPVANRTRIEVEPLIGCFINMLVLRGDLSGAPTLRQAVRQVRQAAVEAYENADVPLQKLMEELHRESSGGRDALFQVTLGMQEFGTDSLDVAGLKFRFMQPQTEKLQFDLRIAAEEHGEEINLWISYQQELYEETTITRMIEHLKAVLQGMVERGEERVWELELLNEVERKQVLGEWSGSEKLYEQKGIAELFEQQVQRSGNAVALVYEGESLTYSELNERTNQLAHYLRKRGIARESRVGICMERGLEMVVAIIGTLKAEAAYVPLDPTHPEDRLEYMVGDAGVMLVLMHGRTRTLLGRGRVEQVVLDEAESWKPICNESRENLKHESGNGRDHLAYVIYTSGTTGKPKGVMIPEEAILYRLFWAIEKFPLEPSDAVLQKTAFNFDASVWEILVPLLQGARLVMAKPGGQQDSHYLAKTVQEKRITVLQLVPSMLGVWLQEKEVERCGKTLKWVFSGGEALTREVVERFRRTLSGVQLQNLYGPTEASIDAISWSCAEELVLEQAYVPLGRPLTNARIYIANQELALTPVGVAGEIYIGGQGLARGYAGKPELTAERFIPNPFASKTGERLYRTGDLGRYRADGVIEYLGRKDEQVKVRGYRIELGEIEAELARHEGVKEAAVAVQEDLSGEKRLVGYVVMKPAAENVGEAGLKQYLSWNLPEYMVPSLIMEIEELPRSLNGKLDRKALPEPVLLSRNQYVPPRTGTEEMVAQVWSEVLKAERVGAEDNFFDLGGHSLLATQLMARVRDMFGVEIALGRLFENATVEALAHEIEEELRGGKGARRGAITLRSEQEKKKLSYGQQRLWFLEQLEPGASAYNLSSGIRLEGDLNIGVLERSLNEVMERHESLRTRFELNKQGEPQQVVGKPEELKIKLTIHEVAGRTAEEKQAEVKRLTQEEERKPFDLKQGPLMRVQLLRVSSEQHVALFTLHHIVSDGWSQGVLVEEIGRLYTAHMQGEQPVLDPLPIQYGDYAAWQREWLQGEVLERQLEYWRKQLEGMTGILELPTDHPRPAVQSYEGTHYLVSFGEKLSRRLQEVARQENVTLYMLLLASLDVLLWRYSGDEDIAIGSPIANRTHKETEKLIGFFVNTLVVRNRVERRASFTDLLKQVRETALGAYAHQDVPFERLVEELNPNRDLSRSPLFQVMFALQNQPQQELQLPGLKLTTVEAESATSKFDLSFYVNQAEKTLEAAIEYNTGLFEHATTERMWKHWEELLRAIAEAPHRTVEDLPILSEQERREVLEKWNRTEREYPAGKTVVELFEEQVSRTPQRIAVSYAGEKLTYDQLNRRANQLAHRLMKSGVHQEQVVGIALDRSLNMLVALLGVLKAGGAYVPMDPEYPAARLQYMLENSGLLLVITRTALLQHLPALSVPVVTMDGDASIIARENEDNPSRIINPENAAYVIYTSGSTGRPKGVIITHLGLTNFLLSMSDAFGQPTAAEEWVAITSISFDISALELFWTLTRGDSVILHPGITRQDAGRTTRKHLDFSLFFFSAADDSGKQDAYRLLLEGSRFADEHGFHAVWTPERHFHAFGGLYPNPSVTGAAVAAITRNLEIRAGSVVMPLHDPLRTAEEWSVVDNISGGRVGISFASGWHVNDFVLSPEDYTDRKAIMLRNIEVVRSLWRGETISRVNGAGKEIPVRIHPRPIQPELPVWLTAAGNVETFRVAGEIGAGLLTHLLGQSVDELKEKIAAYRSAYRQAGHPGKGSVVLMLHTFIGDDEESTRSIVRGPFCRYLQESVDLLKQMARGEGIEFDPKSISSAELDALLALGFDRYYQTSGLMGTEESCLAMLYRVAEADVDEIGCLIDFGVAAGPALEGLQRLAGLKDRWERIATAHEDWDWNGKNVQCTPSFAQGLLEQWKSEQVSPVLGKLLVGGEALPSMLSQELGPMAKDGIYNMYGPTETTIWSAMHPVNETAGTVPIGRPIANTQIYLLDENMGPVPVGVPGELYIGGVGLARGYSSNPDLTAERFVPDRFARVVGQRLYRTGDKARYLPDGNIEFLGRIDQQSKIRGYRIEPGEIEAVLREHVSVANAVAIVREDTPGARRLVAYVVARDDHKGQAGSDQLKEYLRGKLPEYMVPEMVIELEEIPLTPNGKLDRKNLPKPGAVRVKKEYIAPRTEVEEVLAMVWADLLHVERVGIEDNFFELGGHSLLATQLIARVAQIFKVNVPLQSLFMRGTLAGMAKALIENEPRPGQVNKIARLAKPLFIQTEEEADAALQTRNKNTADPAPAEHSTAAH